METETIMVEKVLERGKTSSPYSAMGFADSMGPPLSLLSLNTVVFESGGRTFYTPHGTIKILEEGERLKVRKMGFSLFGMLCDLEDSKGNCYSFA